MIKQKLIDLLETFHYPVSLQGSYQEGETLPDSFFTFWNYETNLRYKSNKVSEIEYVYRVFFYSKEPVLVNAIFKQVRELLINNNFHCTGDYDIDTDVESYTGREMEVRYLEIQ